VLWIVRKKRWLDGFLFSLYLIGYGVARFFIEFFRESDPQLGCVLWFLSMGQVLCVIMALCGVGIMIAVTVHRRERQI
jgi:Prolipoprotein diacylglyceryltransferase